MFKLESYITPILLSYVDKYIKNFRPEDSQVISDLNHLILANSAFFKGVFMGR